MLDNHGNPPPVQLVYCLFKTGKRIAPSDILCRFSCIVCSPSSTQTGLIRFSSSNRERTSSPKQSGLVPIERTTTSSSEIASRKIFFQIFHRRVRVRIRLEIGDELMHRPLLLQEGFLLPDLFRDGFVSVPAKSPERPHCRNAAPVTAGAVPVRTRHPAVERELVHFSPNVFFR